MKRCKVCGRLYAGWRCPCRKKQRSRGKCATCGGGRRARLAQARSRVLAVPLGELPESDAANGAPADIAGASLCLRCGTPLDDEGRCPACFERAQ